MADLMSHEDFRACLVRCGQLLTQITGSFITLDAPDTDELTYRGVEAGGQSQLHPGDEWARTDLLRDCLTQFQVDVARAGGGMWPFEGSAADPIPKIAVHEEVGALVVAFSTDRERLELRVTPRAEAGPEAG